MAFNTLATPRNPCFGVDGSSTMIMRSFQATRSSVTKWRNSEIFANSNLPSCPSKSTNPPHQLHQAHRKELLGYNLYNLSFRHLNNTEAQSPRLHLRLFQLQQYTPQDTQSAHPGPYTSPDYYEHTHTNSARQQIPADRPGCIFPDLGRSGGASCSGGRILSGSIGRGSAGFGLGTR